MDVCLRCKEPTEPAKSTSGVLRTYPSASVRRAGYCWHCGVKSNRVVRRIRRRIIGGKRGRNSGTVKASKQKK